MLLLFAVIMSLLVPAAGPAPPCDPALFSQRGLPPRLDQAVAGGQVRDGPFTFCLFLYADPAMLPPGSAPHPSVTTSVPGIGMAAVWVYQGDGIDGRITESFGLLPDGVGPVSGLGHLRDGQSGGRIGGGVPLLPQGFQAGDRVGLGFKLDTPQGTFGARLGFEVWAEGVRDASVEPW